MGAARLGRELFLALPYFDHIYRLLPAPVRREGGTVGSVPVNHRPRLHGRSKYGVGNRLWAGIVDLFGAPGYCGGAGCPERSAVATERVWLLVGFLGQALFSARFLVQWLSSEREGRSAIPRAFWLFGIGGGVTLPAYALYRADPVFIVGQLADLFIYGRNLHLIARDMADTGPGRSMQRMAFGPALPVDQRGRSLAAVIALEGVAAA